MKDAERKQMLVDRAVQIESYGKTIGRIALPVGLVAGLAVVLRATRKGMLS